MKKNIKSFVIGGFVASSLGALAVNIPNSFSAGQPIKASDVNANFSSLKTAVDALEGGSGVKVPLALTGTGAGLGGATLQATNSNGGIGALVNQSKTGATDAALVTIQSGTGPIFKGFGSNGGEDEFRVDSNGTVTLRKPDNTPNITLDNSLGRVVAPDMKVTRLLDVTGGIRLTGDPVYGQIFNAYDKDNNPTLTMFQSGDLLVARNVGAQAFNVTSDRNAKTNFSSVNSLAVLEKVSHLKIQRWNYKTDTGNLQHVGPMAQDFHAAFNLNGSDDKHISVVDAQGVALAAIQGLNQKLEQKTAKISDLEMKLAALESRLAALEKK
jgi:Chaperone of endosialidase